jgi:outer membrane protein OmpA-like peptidoglycan-associated protein
MFNMKASLFFVLVVWQLNCQAQDVKMYTGKAPSAEEMGNILFSQSNEGVGVRPSGIKMRSISFGSSKKIQPETPIVKAQKSQNASIGLPIKFEYDSATVLDESKAFLNEVGKMLSMEDFNNEKLVIEGHTDGRGSKNYNQQLSEKRAASVKKYLKSNFNIAETRLSIVGMGESQPLPDVNNYASVNRRVQFRKAP